MEVWNCTFEPKNNYVEDNDAGIQAKCLVFHHGTDNIA